MTQNFPLWLEIAAREIGQKELPGPFQNNSKIVEYHKSTTLKASQDEVPWCSSFACWAMEQSGVESPRSAAAASWGQWGAPCEAKLGAIVLLRFDPKTNASGAHVGFLWWSDPGKLLVLGGNQKDSVNVTSFNPNRLIGFRWPSHWLSGLPMNDLGRNIV